MQKPIFINEFQKGQAESATLGVASMVGMDTYSEKGVVRLAKKSVITASGFGGVPHFIDVAGTGVYTWVQCSDGSVVASSDGGANFSTTSFPSPTAGETAGGNGLITFQGYVFAFTSNSIYYHNVDPSSGSWSAAWKTGLQALSSSPISNVHTPFLFPSSRGFYFCNGGSIGFIGQNGTTTFNPAGSAGIDYIYNATIFSLPSLTYTTTSLEFLPPSNLAIAAYPYQSPGQGADLITWDTTSVNKFSPPLRLYSDSLTNGVTLTGGIKQMISRNQVLYVVSGGNHSIFETNGSTFNLIDNIGLYSNLRTAGGAESTYPVYYNSYPQAISILGNKLLTAPAQPTNTATYPTTAFGFYPVGIWSVAFNEDGTKSTQCEFILPLSSSLVGPIGTDYYSKFTCIKPISTVGSSTYKLVAGFALNNGTFPNTYGVVVVDLYKYIDDINYTSLESELFEIGTALNPQVVNNIEINFQRKLLTGQKFDMAYRTGLDQAWTTLGSTVSGDGTENSYKITGNAIGPTQFVQLRFRMSTGASGNNTSETPELRSIKVS